MRRITTLLLLFFIINNALAQSGDPIIISRSLFVPVEKTMIFQIGDKNIPVKVLQYGEAKDFVCINLHANETTSVTAAKAVLEQTGGTLIRIENNRQRVIRFRLNGITYGFDPNRMFSRTGIEQTLRENRKISGIAVNEVEKFADRLLQFIDDSVSCIIALHNNTEEAYSVKSYLPGGNREKDAKAVFADSTQDVDDIAFTTDSLLYQKMTDYGFNSIWQDNEKVKKDGSLSVYCGENNKRYINIETQHGRVEQYMLMLEKLLLFLSEENNKTPELPDEKADTESKIQL